jgi:methionine sulfoxide reductase heme-binding subunit
MHLTSAPIDWYVARASGLTAYILLTAVVVVGMTMGAKRTLPGWPRFTVEDVHRFGGLLVGSFLTIHVVTIAVDAWLPFSLQSLIVPFLSRYRPLWVGLGVISIELLIALAITNHYRQRLPYVFWRRAHYLNFAVWTGATIHGLGSGTDRSSPWMLAIFALATASVAGTVVWRAWPRAARLGVPAALVAAGLIVVLGIGPFRFKPKPWNAASFSASLTGRIAQLNGVSRGIVSMAGEATGAQSVLVRADLLIAPQKLLRTAFQMEYLPSGERCSGTVTKVDPTGFSAVCRLPGGLRRAVTASWQLGVGNTVSGVISVHP